MQQTEQESPRYLQIADALLEQIESGEFRPGDRLPSERKLGEMFHVTRMTVRQALRVLEMRGLLTRHQGSGTYVSRPKIERLAAELVPFTKGMREQGYLPGATVITFESRPASASTAHKLDISVGTPTYYSHRLRYINNEPMMLEKYRLPVAYFPGLEDIDLSQRSVYAVLEDVYGVRIVEANQALEATTATEYEATLLQIETGAPILLEERIGYDETGRAVEFAKDLYRGDRFRFVTQRARRFDY